MCWCHSAVQGGDGAAAAAARPGAQYPETWAWHVPQTETFRWARCKEAAPLPRLQRVGLPLPEALLDVLEPALAWEDLQVRWHTTCGAGRAGPCLCYAVALCGRSPEATSCQHLIMHVGMCPIVFS